MKKYFILISAAILALSCNNEIADTQENVGKVNYKPVTFSSLVTKTTLTEQDGEGVVEWEEGDEISIYYVNTAGEAATAVARTSMSGATATFTAYIPDTENPTEYYATYPKEKGVLAINEQTDETTGETVKTVSFAINTEENDCDGSFRQANFAAAYSTAENMSFAFKNAVGIVKVTLPEGGVVKRGEDEYPITGVYIRCKTDSHKLNGEVPVIVSDGAVSEFGDATGGVANLNAWQLSQEAVKSGVIYIPCTPASWADGICIDYISSAGNIPAVATQDKAVSVNRGAVLPLPDVSSKIRWDYYFAADVTGEGDMTQENPGSLAQAKAMFVTPYVYLNRMMSGVTLHFADGTYTFDSEWAMKFHTTDTPEVTIQGGSATVFDGAAATRLLNIGTVAKLTVKNVTFQNGKPNTDNGGAVYAVASGTLRFENCQFTNNSATTGGALYVGTFATADFEGCTFTGNSGANASVFAINTAKIRCNDCRFYNNTGTADNGAVFYGSTNPAVYCNSCYFNGNGKTYGDNSYGKGIIVYFNGTYGKVGMNNVTVVGGSASASQNIQVLCKGHSVISNSTIWATKCTWGVFAMGYSGTVKGAVLVNSILCNKDSDQPGVGTTDTYQLRSAYNIISTVKPLSGDTLNIYDSEYCVTGMFNGGAPFALKNPAFVWDGTLDKCTDELTGTLTYPTLEQVEAEILKAEDIGKDFLAWLKSIKDANGKTALEVDIRGVARNTSAMWPGSYQNN